MGNVETIQREVTYINLFKTFREVFGRGLEMKSWLMVEMLIERVPVIKGELIIYKDQSLRDILIVESGYFESFSFNELKEKVVKDILQKNEVLSPIGDLITQKKSSVSVNCLSDGAYYRIPWNTLLVLGSREPGVRELAFNLIGLQHALLLKKIDELINNTPNMRLKNLLDEKSDLLAHVSNKVVANYLGLSVPELVSLSEYKAARGMK